MSLSELIANAEKVREGGLQLGDGRRGDLGVVFWNTPLKISKWVAKTIKIAN